jgi:hypothetical protein
VTYLDKHCTSRIGSIPWKPGREYLPRNFWKIIFYQNGKNDSKSMMWKVDEVSHRQEAMTAEAHIK